MLRCHAFSIALLALAGLVPLACSVVVSSELDGKPDPSDPGTDAGTTGKDAEGEADVTPSDAADEADEADADDDASDDAPTEAGCSTCPGSCCDGSCKDLESDPEHCGQCGHACPASRSCIGGACEGGFVAMSTLGAPDARLRACAVWIGSEMFVWGGVDASGTPLNTGAAYDPMQDTWREVSSAGAPTPREEPTCVAMADKVFVWGGVNRNDSTLLADGATWNPDTNEWRPLSENNAPAPRIRATAVWTDEEVLIWGGEKLDEHQEDSGGRYDPGSDTWTSMSSSDRPERNKRMTGVWTGSVLYVFGGRDDGGGNVYNDFDMYSPLLDTWSEVGVEDGDTPSPRSNAFAVWTGSQVVIWGGLDQNGVGMVDGASYNPSNQTWTTLSSTSAPAARGQEPFRSGWNTFFGGRMLIAGGSDTNGAQSDLFLFEPLSPPGDAWSGPFAWTPPGAHEYGVGIWTGVELILWGGTDGTNGSDPTVGGTRWML